MACRVFLAQISGANRSLKALLCQRTTVSGCTIRRESRQPDQVCAIARTQNSLSRSFSSGRFCFRHSTISCWRRATFSAAKFLTLLRLRDNHLQQFLMILCIIEAYPARVVSSILPTSSDRCERRARARAFRNWQYRDLSGRLHLHALGLRGGSQIRVDAVGGSAALGKRGAVCLGVSSIAGNQGSNLSRRQMAVRK